MKRIKRRTYIPIIVILLFFLLSACTPSPDFEVYKGNSLQIAVVGEVPDIKEKQVRFTEISLEKMKLEELKQYDAVIITENHLFEAAKNQYVDVYLDSPIPFFFMGTNTYVPFIEKDMDYEKTMNWKPGIAYATGILRQSNDTIQKWEYGLYNDKKTDEHIQDVYSQIFKTVDSLKVDI